MFNRIRKMLSTKFNRTFEAKISKNIDFTTKHNNQRALPKFYVMRTVIIIMQ